jgi:hypothetical protein
MVRVIKSKAEILFLLHIVFMNVTHAQNNSDDKTCWMRRYDEYIVCVNVTH